MKQLTIDIVLDEYNEKGRSFRDIAQEYGTYPNKIKRMFIKAGGIPRDKSNAQKEALKSGRSDHPTEGRKRTEQELVAISEGVAKSWANASEATRSAHSEASKKQWEKKSQAEREELLKKARDAARLAATTGSKLENAVVLALQENGYFVEHQYDDLLENPKLRIDIFIPQISTAIEIDGPSHFEPIWGEENFLKNQRADMEKTGLLVAHGLCVVRVKNKSRHLSEKMKRETIKKVLETVEKIKLKQPKRYRKLIEIEV
jgi:very-short-patch-repair endonuclease